MGNTSLILQQYEKDLFFNEAEQSSELLTLKKKTESTEFHIRSIFF